MAVLILGSKAQGRGFISAPREQGYQFDLVGGIARHEEIAAPQDVASPLQFALGANVQPFYGQGGIDDQPRDVLDIEPVPDKLVHTRLDKSGRSEEHTSELPSLMSTSYAVFRMKKNK